MSTLQAPGTSILQPVIMSVWKQYPLAVAPQEQRPCHGQGLSHHQDIDHHSSPTGVVEVPRALPRSQAQRTAPRESVLFHGMASQGAEHPHPAQTRGVSFQLPLASPSLAMGPDKAGPPVGQHSSLPSGWPCPHIPAWPCLGMTLSCRLTS